MKKKTKNRIKDWLWVLGILGVAAVIFVVLPIVTEPKSKTVSTPDRGGIEVEPIAPAQEDSSTSSARHHGIVQYEEAAEKPGSEDQIRVPKSFMCAYKGRIYMMLPIRELGTEHIQLKYVKDNEGYYREWHRSDDEDNYRCKLTFLGNEIWEYRHCRGTPKWKLDDNRQPIIVGCDRPVFVKKEYWLVSSNLEELRQKENLADTRLVRDDINRMYVPWPVASYDTKTRQLVLISRGVPSGTKVSDEEIFEKTMSEFQGHLEKALKITTGGIISSFSAKSLVLDTITHGASGGISATMTIICAGEELNAANNCLLEALKQVQR